MERAITQLSSLAAAASVTATKQALRRTLRHGPATGLHDRISRRLFLLAIMLGGCLPLILLMKKA